MLIQVNDKETVIAAATQHPSIAIKGGGSKTALVRAAPVVMDMSGLRGVLEYEPDEFTFTALAGTPVREINTLLAQHGQYLPFDPLLADKGATLGGTVAANSSGPGRYRYGGVRDFILGVQFVDGRGSWCGAAARWSKMPPGLICPN